MQTFTRLSLWCIGLLLVSSSTVKSQDLAAKNAKFASDSPEGIEKYLEKVQEKLFKAYSLDNPLASDDAVKEVHKELNSLINLEATVLSLIELERDPFRVSAPGVMWTRKVGNVTFEIEIKLMRNFINTFGIRLDSGLSNVSIVTLPPSLIVGRDMDPATFKSLNGKETCLCWGIIKHWESKYNTKFYNRLSLELVGTIISEPLKNTKVFHKNEIPEGGKWNGLLKYEDGSDENIELKFLRFGDLKWKSYSDDKYFRAYESEEYINGNITQNDNKIVIKLLDTNKNNLKFSGTFEGEMKNGLLLRGTFIKDRITVGRPKRDVIDPNNLTLKKDCKGSFILFRPSGN